MMEGVTAILHPVYSLLPLLPASAPLSEWQTGRGVIPQQEEEIAGHMERAQSMPDTRVRQG